MAQSKNKALTLADRNAIEQAISNGSTKTAIAQTRGKDKSTIGKEIKLHRYVASRMKCYATKYPSSIRGFCNGLGSPTSINRLRERVAKNGTLFSMAAIDRG